jgi:hypothetical protein
MTDWKDISCRPSKGQRRALYKFSINRSLVQHLTSTEADEMLRLLVQVARRQARVWAEREKMIADILLG